MPPSVIGHQKFDLYEATTKPRGDVAKAKQELAACGHPNGFSTSFAYRSDRPKEKAMVYVNRYYAMYDYASIGLR